jgi:hypothetical protein
MSRQTGTPPPERNQTGTAPGKAGNPMPERVWSTGQLAGFELKNKREELERTLTRLAPGSVKAAGMLSELDEIIAEQQSRAKARARTHERRAEPGQ